MKQIVSLSMALLLGISSVVAQQRVEGVVVDNQDHALEFVNVVAMRLPDSSFVAGRVTDAKGAFLFEGLPSECYLVFSSIGYQKQSLNATPQMRVVLNEMQTELSEVSVVARRLTERPGGYSMRMRNNPLMKGKKIIQALELLPNISIDNGRVGILNRAVEAIYVDGLPIQENELAALPLDQIDSIAVDYSSAVREGATGKGGVLQIFLKRQSNGGWSSNLEAETYHMPYYGWLGADASGFLSARWEKLTIRNSIFAKGYCYLGDEQSTYHNKSAGIEQKSIDRFRNWANVLSNRLSVSYEITPKHFAATSVRYRYNLEEPEHSVEGLQGSADTYQRQKNPTHLLQWLAKYKWTISPETALSLSADWLNRRTRLATEVQTPSFDSMRMAQNTQMSG